MGGVGGNFPVLDQSGFCQNDGSGADGGHQLARFMHFFYQMNDFRRIPKNPGARPAGQDQSIQLVGMELIQHGVRGDGYVVGADHLV